MVTAMNLALLSLPIAAEKANELPPTTRAAALMALLGILLLGMLLVVMILLGGNWVRRLGNYRRGRAVPPDREPLRSHQSPDDVDPSIPHDGDTIVDKQSNDTTVL